jgi:hypothetical protein
MMNYKTLAAASLASIVWTSYAFAQCPDCALYPNRDPLNKGVKTPAGKMGVELPGGAAPSFTGRNPYARIQGYYLQQSGAPQVAPPKIRLHHQR